jgi:DNA modification methylase
MGAGLPEYLLIFRKPATDNSNAYADTPVTHSKKDYTRGRWQIDAHAHWNSNGERLFDESFLRKHDLDEILKIWKSLEFENGYNYEEHVQLCETLDKIGKLPTSFMSLPPQSYSDDVWTDINRMNTLNSEQARRNLTKHICPLQIDIIKRCIERYSNKGDIVLDPFGGICSVPYQAVMMDRFGVSVELNTDYYKDGLKHMKRAELKNAQISMF